MNENNFNKIKNHSAPPKKVKANVKSRLNNIKFIGSLMGLYMIKPVSVLFRKGPKPKSFQKPKI